MSAPTRGPVINRLPAGLFVVTVAALLAGIVVGLLEPAPAAPLTIGVLLVHLAWLLVEARVTFRRSGPAAPDPTVLPYGLARTGVVVAGVFGAPGPLGWVAAAVFGAGIVLRLWAIAELGRFYTHRVMRHDGHRIVTSGPYRALRHPAYTGMLAASLGYTSCLPTAAGWLSLAALAAALVWRIRAEERMLLTIPAYVGFARCRARLVPGVW